jgi:quercetin dioxygenase-like cupin family protein
MNVQEAVSATLKVVRPGEGRVGRLGPGVHVNFKIDGADTGGALSVVEHPFDVGALVRPHVHTREDEISIVLEGEIGFRSEDQEVVLGPGGYIIKPRNQVHAMWNAGSAPARMIEIISPAGFEGFFRGFADLNDAGPIDPADVAALAADYGLPYAEPEWLPDIVTRYGLTPPPPRPSQSIGSEVDRPRQDGV